MMTPFFCTLATLSQLLILAAPTMVASAILFDAIALKHSCINEDGSTCAPGSPVHLPKMAKSILEGTVLFKQLCPPTATSTSASSSPHPNLRTDVSSYSDKSGGGDCPAGTNTGDLNYWTRPCSTGGYFAIGKYSCDITLPSASKRISQDPTKADVTVHNKISLLEILKKNTFDPTSTTGNESLDDGEDGGPLSRSEVMAKHQRDWISSQMDPNTFATVEYLSSCKYWRRRLNTRKGETYHIGEAGPRPCDERSRWCKVAFMHADFNNSRIMCRGKFDIGSTYQTQKANTIPPHTTPTNIAPSCPLMTIETSPSDPIRARVFQETTTGSLYGTPSQVRGMYVNFS